MRFNRNSKLKASSHAVWGFGLPAGQTCPGAGACRAWCYATRGNYHRSSVKTALERNLTESRQPGLPTYRAELNRLVRRSTRRGERLAIRIHTSGDFYSDTYLAEWIAIARDYPDVLFYTYTKSVELFRNCGCLPANLNIVASAGGCQPIPADWTGPIAVVVDQLTGNPGTVDGSNDDSVALTARGRVTIELVRH